MAKKHFCGHHLLHNRGWEGILSRCFEIFQLINAWFECPTSPHVTSLLTLFFRHSICTCTWIPVLTIWYLKNGHITSYWRVGRLSSLPDADWQGFHGLTGTFAGAFRTQCQTPEFFSMHSFSIDSSKEYWMSIDKRGTGFLAFAWFGSSPPRIPAVSLIGGAAHRKTEKERQLAHGRGGQGVGEDPNYTTSIKPGRL